jgi:prophage regulatory protein
MLNAILRLPAVEARVGLRRTQIYQWVRRGVFPAPIKLSSRSSGWLESEINDWLAARIAESRSGEPKTVAKRGPRGRFCPQSVA